MNCLGAYWQEAKLFRFGNLHCQLNGNVSKLLCNVYQAIQNTYFYAFKIKTCNKWQ